MKENNFICVNDEKILLKKKLRELGYNEKQYKFIHNQFRWRFINDYRFYHDKKHEYMCIEQLTDKLIIWFRWHQQLYWYSIDLTYMPKGD